MKKIFASVVLVLFAAAVYAQGGSALLIPSDARALAMGVSALQPGASTLDANVFYGMWAPQTVDNTVLGADAFFRLNDRLAFSVEGRSLKDKPYTVTNAKGVAEGEFTPSDMIVGLGASYFINEQLSVGLKARMLSSSIAPDIKGSAMCFDLRAGYATELFNAGLSLRNVGSQIDYGAGGYALPAYAALDGTVSPVDGLTAAFDAGYLFSGALMAGLGVEYTVLDMVSLRAGYHYGDAAKALPSYASAGLGVQFAGLKLDAAYLLASDALGSTLFLSLGYAF
ncbi:MAG: PorV/PorQ family protein [Bacteroidales bacterium]|nr:PorV/PorQ family protein [Bacteroidales bacterium]